MYGYQQNLYSLDEIFSSINQEEIFKYVFGNFNVGTYITSPFRVDDSPGCWIQWRNGKLYFTDFGNKNGKVNLDAIGIIQEKHNLGFKDAIEFVLSFNFNEESEYKKYKSSSIVSSSNVSIEYCPKPFDIFAKNYWSLYEISSTQLIQDNIFATKWFKVSGMVFQPYSQEACYTISFGDTCKICRPKAKTNKWVTNTNKNIIGGTKNLPFLVDNLVISKSYKDWRVLTNLGLNAIYFQNEGMFPDMEILETYLKMTDRISIIFDNDEKGKESSKKLCEYINNYFPNKASNYILPTQEKDPADVIKAGKKQDLVNFINSNFH